MLRFSLPQRDFCFAGLLVAISLLLLFILPGIAFAAPTLSLSPVSGPSGTKLTVTGAGFDANQPGSVWFDTNGDGLKDSDEPQSDVSSDDSGRFSTVLTVPSLPPGYYLIRADIPGGGPTEAHTLFTVRRPSLTLGINSGPAGTAIIISGRYFAPGRDIWVWFDTNNNYTRDSGEPAMRVTADTAGAFYASLTVPNVAAGAYPIRASLSESSHTDSEVIFTAIPRLTLSPTGGSPGTLITITGSGFEANKSGPAWFDTNRDGILTEGEPSSQATSDASGRIITTLVVPGGFISTGSYPVRVELPQGSPVKVSANFIIKGPSLALSASKAIPGGTINVVGRRFPANTAGWVWFDANGNSARDAGEVSKKVTTNSYGGFITGMTIPKVPAGVHYIRADLPGSGTDDAAVTIVILAEPSLSLSLTNGSPGTIIIINGKDFKTWTSGRVWFDIDGDGKKDAGEPAKNVKTDNFGKFRAALAVPERVKRGAYAVYADIPAWGKPEAWADFFVTSNRPSDDVNGHALDVVRTTPYDDAANVKRYPAIQVVFNGRIIKGADYWGISLSDEDGNEVRIKIAIRNNSIKVWPSGMLKKETTYMLFIPADAVQDMREKGLSEEFALTFTTKK